MLSQAESQEAVHWGSEKQNGKLIGAAPLTGCVPAGLRTAWPASNGSHGLHPGRINWNQMELESLRQQERDQAQTMLILMHELRAPVAASKALAASLRYVNDHDQQTRDALGRIETRMDQLLDLVDDILDLSQVRTGQTLGEEDTVDLVSETESFCQPLREQAMDKGLSLALHLPAGPVFAYLALRAYHLILSNLVCNAIKYTPAGSVQVTLRQEGNWARLQVTDTGIGVPANEMSQLCSEFFRASNARHSQIRGSGLGLAGVKGLVERYDGELLVESQEGKGSTFTVRLPRDRAGMPDSAWDMRN